MAKRNRHKTKKEEAPVYTDSEAKELAKSAWTEAIQRAVELDRWCEDCNSPLWYIAEENREFCMTCWAVANAINVAKKEFDKKLYDTVSKLQFLDGKRNAK